ncbi:MAG: hypothetical protein V2B18_23915 [Pseudomonadota bacterium]
MAGNSEERLKPGPRIVRTNRDLVMITVGVVLMGCFVVMLLLGIGGKEKAGKKRGPVRDPRRSMMLQSPSLPVYRHAGEMKNPADGLTELLRAVT